MEAFCYGIGFGIGASAGVLLLCGTVLAVRELFTGEKRKEIEEMVLANNMNFVRCLDALAERLDQEKASNPQSELAALRAEQNEGE